MNISISNLSQSFIMEMPGLEKAGKIFELNDGISSAHPACVTLISTEALQQHPCCVAHAGPLCSEVTPLSETHRPKKKHHYGVNWFANIQSIH